MKSLGIEKPAPYWLSCDVTQLEVFENRVLREIFGPKWDEFYFMVYLTMMSVVQTV
jgi:hypothetical protein